MPYNFFLEGIAVGFGHPGHPLAASLSSVGCDVLWRRTASDGCQRSPSYVGQLKSCVINI